MVFFICTIWWRSGVVFDLSASLSVCSICISGSSFLATAQPSMDYLGSAGTTEQGKQDRILARVSWKGVLGAYHIEDLGFC